MYVHAECVNHAEYGEHEDVGCVNHAHAEIPEHGVTYTDDRHASRSWHHTRRDLQRHIVYEGDKPYCIVPVETSPRSHL